jgi:hypothetical protein
LQEGRKRIIINPEYVAALDLSDGANQYDKINEIEDDYSE